MNQDDRKIHISSDTGPEDFSLEDILLEYRQELARRPAGDESLNTRSKRIVMEALDQTISEVSFSSIDDIIGDAIADAGGHEPRDTAPYGDGAYASVPGGSKKGGVGAEGGNAASADVNGGAAARIDAAGRPVSAQGAVSAPAGSPGTAPASGNAGDNSDRGSGSGGVDDLGLGGDFSLEGFDDDLISGTSGADYAAAGSEQGEDPTESRASRRQSKKRRGLFSSRRGGASAAHAGSGASRTGAAGQHAGTAGTVSRTGAAAFHGGDSSGADRAYGADRVSGADRTSGADHASAGGAGDAERISRLFAPGSAADDGAQRRAAGTLPENGGAAAKNGGAGHAADVNGGAIDAPEAENGPDASRGAHAKGRGPSENLTGGGRRGGERFLSPLLALLALVALRRGQRTRGEEQAPTEDTEDRDVPEMEPGRAVRLYSGQALSMRLRGRLALAMTLVMIYLSFAWYSSLPLLGALKNSAGTVALTLLVFEMTVMVIGLDVVTSGIMALVRRRPNFDSLAAASCVLSMLDAAVIAAADLPELGIPFCAVSALTLTCCIWGGSLTCRGYRSGFKLLAMSKNLSVLTGESGVTSSGVALLKSKRSVKGFISRSEEADLPEYVYSVLTPASLALALVLGLLASVGRGRAFAAVHCISVIAAAAGAFSGAVCFALPFSITARRLFQSGAAIAGWSGTRDIGKSRQVVICDNDVFPQGTVDISSIRILEGAFTDKVISYTGSVIAASGSGLAQPFSDLIRRNGYSISRVENFTPHDGGGMAAVVNGESVYVGSTGFMNLMGIRIPQKLTTPSSVYTAINGALVGIFLLNYKPIASVQDALVLLLRSGREPVFAIRDFNITPMMIKKKFHLPTDEFDFPSYSERYRISGAQPDGSSKIAAVISRDGMGPLVDAADRGRRLFTAVRTGTALSAAGTALGVLLMFLLCWTGAFDSATASNVLVFMLLWLVPTLVIGWGLQR